MKNHFTRNRKMRYGGITVLLTVLVIVVTVLANAVVGTLASRYLWYTSMTPDYTLSGVTEACFSFLDEVFADAADTKVEIIFCDLEENLNAELTTQYVYETATTIAGQYPEHIHVSCYDIWTNPNTVKQYKTTVNPITGETSETSLTDTSVIITAGTYQRVYALKEFYVFEDGDTSDLWAYNGEKKLAAGIMRAAKPNAPVACLLTNHGEVFYDYELLYLLDDAGYAVAYIDLYSDEIPSGCNLIISYNPNTDLIDDDVSERSETAVLDSFLAEDGNTFLVLLENGTPSLPNFEKYLENWGVAFDYYTDKTNDISYRYTVQDATQSLTSDGCTIYGEAVKAEGTAAFFSGTDRKVIFKNATSMRASQGFVNNGDGSYTNGNRTLYSLYESGSGAVCWANGNPVGGSGSMLMSVTEQKTENATSYVGVIASVDFSAEDFLQSAVYGNSDLMLCFLQRFCGQLTPQGMTVKPLVKQGINLLTTAQMLRWTLVLSLTPAIVISVVAVAVLTKRRRA